MSLSTFLGKLGADFKKVFSYAQPIEQAALPFIQAAFPAVGAAINLVFNEVAKTEAAFQGSNMNAQSGPQKLATVVNTVGPAVIELLAQEGVKADTSTVSQIVNATVAVLNAIPAADPSFHNTLNPAPPA